MTEQELTLIMNEKICDIADALILYYDPCKMNGSACKAGDPNPCCKHTRFGTDGCPFWDGKCDFRNAKCKLWFCETAIKDTDSRFIDSIKTLEQLGKLYALTSRPFLGQGYIGADRPK
jgi:hypothetical protein